jgi:hypothetical protein
MPVGYILQPAFGKHKKLMRLCAVLTIYKMDHVGLFAIVLLGYICQWVVHNMIFM